MEAWSKETQSGLLVQEPPQTEDVLPPAHRGLQQAPTQGPQNQEPFIPSQPDAGKVSLAPIPNPRSMYAMSARSHGLEMAQGSADTPSGAEKPRACLVLDPSAAGQGKAVNVALLLKELDILRDTNTKLREALSEKDVELQTLKLERELHGAATEAGIAERTAALVEEVYLAQRERDQAVMARLRLANEERDDAILRAKRLEQSLRELENIHPEGHQEDPTLQELVSRVQKADSGAMIERNGAILADRILKTKERKKQITAEEMNAVIAERDTAVAQCKWLEQELRHVREKTQTSANVRCHVVENHPQRAEKVQCMSLQQDRDAAIEEYKKLEEELQTLRVYHSLHQSLSQEVNLKEQFKHAINLYEEALRNREKVAAITQQQNEELAAQAQHAISERAFLEAKLLQAQAAVQEAEEKVHKLERLVDVLRKKVGAGTLRTMI